MCFHSYLSSTQRFFPVFGPTCRQCCHICHQHRGSSLYLAPYAVSVAIFVINTEVPLYLAPYAVSVAIFVTKQRFLPVFGPTCCHKVLPYLSSTQRFLPIFGPTCCQCCHICRQHIGSSLYLAPHAVSVAIFVINTEVPPCFWPHMSCFALPFFLLSIIRDIIL